MRLCSSLPDRKRPRKIKLDCAANCEVLLLDRATRDEQLSDLFVELGRRRMTNVLVEGGGTVLGALFDAGFVDEVLAFIAPKIVGGADAKTPVAGEGRELISQALSLGDVEWQQIGEDLLLLRSSTK